MKSAMKCHRRPNQRRNAPKRPNVPMPNVATSQEGPKKDPRRNTKTRTRTRKSTRTRTRAKTKTKARKKKQKNKKKRNISISCRCNERTTSRRASPCVVLFTPRIRAVVVGSALSQHFPHQLQLLRGEGPQFRLENIRIRHQQSATINPISKSNNIWHKTMHNTTDLLGRAHAVNHCSKLC